MGRVSDSANCDSQPEAICVNDDRFGKGAGKRSGAAVRSYEYEARQAGKPVVARDDDLENVPVELEVSVIRGNLQLERNLVLGVNEVDALSKAIANRKLR